MSTLILAQGAVYAPDNVGPWHLVPLMLAEVPMPEVSSTGHEAETEALTSEELLVEEVSIDGMCGVY